MGCRTTRPGCNRVPEGLLLGSAKASWGGLSLALSTQTTLLMRGHEWHRGWSGVADVAT